MLWRFILSLFHDDRFSIIGIETKRNVFPRKDSFEMTAVKVVSSLTTLSGCGTVEIGDVSVSDITIGDIKMEIETRTSISIRDQKLWWRGYILDDNLLSLITACVGKYRCC